MIGEKGTQVSSITIWKNGKTERIDVKNPAPRERPGQIHYHDSQNDKWYYESKKAYESGARAFIETNKNTAEIYVGEWNSSRGIQTGQEQIIVRAGGKQAIINKTSCQTIDFYEGASLDGVINIERAQ